MPVERVDPELVEFDLRSDEMLINMGPQHPSTHGVLRLVLRTDGEVVGEVTPHIGYLHRCAEKIGENLSPRQFLPYTDRLDYLAGMNMNLGWSLAVEKLLGFVPSERTAAPAGAGLRVGPHRQPPRGRRLLRPRPGQFHALHVEFSRARENPLPLRGTLRRPADVQLHHARRRDGRPARRAG